MDNMNNNINQINIDNSPSNEQGFEPQTLPYQNYKPKPNKFIEILIALSKCAGYVLIWLGVQVVLGLMLSVILMIQSIGMTPDEIDALYNEAILKHSITLTVLTNLISLGIYYLIFRLTKKSFFKKIKTDLPDNKSYLPTIALGFSAQFVTNLVLGLLMNVLKVFPQKWVDELTQNNEIVDIANPVLSFFAVVILAPVFEEILCRGLLLNTLRKTMPKWGAIVVSAVIFGIIHGNPIQFIYATALGILLGWIYTKFDSILIPMLCHLVFNLISQIASYFNPENMVFTVIFGLITYASVPIFVLTMVYLNIGKFKKPVGEVSENPQFVPYQYPTDTQFIKPEYNEGVLNRLTMDIEGKPSNDDENKE